MPYKSFPGIQPPLRGSRKDQARRGSECILERRPMFLHKWTDSL